MPVYEFAGLRVDISAREVMRDGRPVPLPPRVHDLLAYLLAQRHRVVSKQELLAEVWRGADVSEAVIHRAMVVLREALRDSKHPAAMVRTVHRVGYRFVALVQEIDTAPPRAEPAGAPSGPGAPGDARATHALSQASLGGPLTVALQRFENATGSTAHDWACWGLPRLVCESLAPRQDIRLIHLDEVVRILKALPSHQATHETLGRLLGARWTVSGRIERGDETGLRLAYTVHGGPAGARPLVAPDVSGLSAQLSQALVHLADSHQTWSLDPPADDVFLGQAMARAQSHIARTEWEAAANLLKVVLDFDPAHTAARLLWLTVLPQLNDETVFREGEKLLEEARRHGDVRLQAATHEILGRAAFNRNAAEWSVAGQRHLEEALRLARPWAHEDWVLRIHLNLGYVLQLQCDRAGARRHYEAVLRRLGEGGNPRFRAAALNNAALIEYFQESPLVAVNMASEALRLSLRESQFHTAVTCRATLALVELEVGWVQRAETLVTDNLAELAGHAALHADSTAWALFVAAWVGFALRGGPGHSLAQLRQVSGRVTAGSAHAEALLAATAALAPLLDDPGPDGAVQEAAQALLDAMERFERSRLHEHTRHVARLALECALRSRSGSMLWRIRRFLEARPEVCAEPGLRRALHRAAAAEQVWQGETEQAVASLTQAVAGAPGGRFQALARLDLMGLLMAHGRVAEAAEQSGWVAPWLESLPEGLAARAMLLALQGDFDAAVDTQLAALRKRRGQVPAAWYAHLEHYAQGRTPLPSTAPATLLTLE